VGGADDVTAQRLTLPVRERKMTALLRKTSVMKTANLQARLLDLIGRGVASDAAHGASEEALRRQFDSRDAEFNTLALEVFEFQFERNRIYRGWCERQQLTPKNVAHWKQIPAVPTSAFKDFALTCFPVEEAVAEFHTSGTTRGGVGRHFFKTLELYDAAIVPNFEAHLLTEFGGSQSKLQLASAEQTQSKAKFELQTAARPVSQSRLPRLFILAPSPEEAPHSSLSHMMGVVEKRMRAGGTGQRGNGRARESEDLFFVHDGKLEAARLDRELRRAEKAGEAVMLLGTAFSFVHFFDHCERENLRFALASGSRAMETGGFKGKSREMTKAELYGLFETYLGIPASRIVNEYGMTELSTQFYDVALRGKFEIRNPKSEGNPQSKIQNLKSVPPWARVMIVDPLTGKEARKGERGLIRIFDLANLYSVMAVQTEDRGRVLGDGFEVLGRATDVEARGCSIAADEMLGVGKHHTISHAKAQRRKEF
jgi:hypothetical protein